MRNATCRALVITTTKDSEEPMNLRGEASTGRGIRAFAIVAFVAAVPVLATGCSSSKKSASTTTANGGATHVAAPAGTSVDLSGTWKGTYGGSFQGTFELSWTQSGGKLSGTITLSQPAVTLDLSGTINGLKISFGTVGSAAITYTGSVTSTGLVMSGSYKAGTDGGNWGAGKSS